MTDTTSQVTAATEPIVEVKQTSSSSSASSSPLSSRQSSDCDRGQQTKAPHDTPGGDQRLSPTITATSGAHTRNSSPSSSSSSSCASSASSSSRRLIRRRTVRRSYHHHHRALADTTNEQAESPPRSHVVTRTTTTTTRTAGSDGNSAGAQQQVVSTTRLLTPPVVASEQSGTSTSHKLSTSRSSSKIATRITSSSTSSASGSSQNHHQSQSQKVDDQKTMTSSIENLSKQVAGSKHQDLNSSSRHAESLFERRARGHPTMAKFDAGETGVGVHHRSTESLSTSSSFNATASRSLTSSARVGAGTVSGAQAATTTAAISSSSAASSSCETSLTRTSASSNATGGGGGGDLTAALTQRHQSSSADRYSTTSSSSSSMFLSAAAAAAKQRSFLASPDSLLFSSPDLHSFVQEIGTDFAALANSTSLLVKEHQQQHHLFNHHQTTSRLLHRGPAAPPPFLTKSLLPSPGPRSGNNNKSLDSLINETNCTIRELEDNPPARLASGLGGLERGTSGGSTGGEGSSHSAKIQELLDKAQRHGEGGAPPTASGSVTDFRRSSDAAPISEVVTGGQYDESDRCKAVINESIVRIEQRMSDLCRKFASCDDTQKAIDLLKIMVQMIEKAWSVPVCGDDLGFKLCNSLRQFGGLDIILGFVREADELLETGAGSCSPGSKSLDNGGGSCDESGGSGSGSTSATSTMTRAAGQQPPVPAAPPKQQLKLNLSRIHGPEVAGETLKEQQVDDRAKEDDDSDILTSDLGLDSASVESLSYVSAAAVLPTSGQQVAAAPEDNNKASEEQLQEQEKQMQRVRKEELVFLSAHLLSQCLTLENRDYIVQCGQLDPLIKLACNFTTMKSNQSKRLLKRSALMRQSSTINRQQQLAQTNCGAAGDSHTSNAMKEPQVSSAAVTATCGEQRSDMHSAIGTEILQHLFKHSEETCTRMISLSGLQAILYGCRSSHVETLRHCASALANLALYGGPDSQQTMIEQKAHVWLFPLAFNEDDNVQYYACLAIVVLAANQEIEADVLQSSTLDLVEPFVTSHEPRKFAESTTSHIHGQSASWLRKLMPLLDSKREEARNLACFHFAMEAYIKREQGRTALFQEIGSLEPLRRAGSSPIAIASKFACQALRLIGVEEPHKLSQQVPLWTCEDVCEWVAQVGFERFRVAFRDSHVDGDLLLQLDEEMLKFDIGIENGIIRRRFLRELAQLKRIADYSSVDRTQLGHLLMSAAAAAVASPAGVSAHQPNPTMGTLSSTRTGSGHTSYQHTRALLPPAGGGRHQQVMLAAAPALHHLNHPAPTSTLSTGAQARNARDFLQYIYPIIQLGVTRDNIHLVDCDQLLAECKITNALHRIKLAQAIRELQDQNQMALEAAAASHDPSSLQLDGSPLLGHYQKTLDVFVSYRRSTGSQLASLLKVHLQLRGFSVFIDVERLEAGKFDNNLLDSIKQAKNFILVLSPGALDRCIGDHECKDWVHKEIVAALASNCNIIPIIDNFHWPDAEQLPEDMRSITYFNGIRWIHDYQDACVDKVERFIRGELSNSMGGLGGQSLLGAGSTISSGSAGQQVAATPGVSAYGQRLGYATTPSIMGPPAPPPPPPQPLPAPAASTPASSQNFHNNSNTKSLSNQGDNNGHRPENDANETHVTTQTNNGDNNQAHPLANYANPYLQFNSGNVNPNIRLR